MNRLRIVLDSNVVISAFLFSGHPRRVLNTIIDGSADGFTSLPILDEIRDVLQRPKFGLSPEAALTLVEEFHDLCPVVTPSKSVLAVPEDPDDNIVLECAAEAGANMIVSGDSHLLDIDRWRGIRILSPADYMKEIEGQQDQSSVRGKPRRLR